jgi:hypothetical protein
VTPFAVTCSANEASSATASAHPASGHQTSTTIWRRPSSIAAATVVSIAARSRSCAVQARGSNSLAGVTDPAHRFPDEDDDRLHQLVVDCLTRERYAATVEHDWASGPDAWVITVTPANDDAAGLTAWIRDHDFNVGVSHSYTEIFGAKEQSWELVDRLVEAIFAGRIREAGHGDDRFIRAVTRSGNYTFGSAHLPLPWRWRKGAQFARYQRHQTSGPNPTATR